MIEIDKRTELGYLNGFRVYCNVYKNGSILYTGYREVKVNGILEMVHSRYLEDLKKQILLRKKVGKRYV